MSVKLELSSWDMAKMVCDGCTDEQLYELLVDIIDYRDYDGFTTEAIKRIEKLREEKL